jgi:flavin-dependent dehydrogenase
VNDFTSTPAAQQDDFDAIVVGAGPAGSATAYHLAKAGRRVLLLEKSAFPRDKICGDGLTPRAVKQLGLMGFDLSREAGWGRNQGLRIVAGGRTYELPWPELDSFPNYGLVRSRMELDEMLARHAASAGAVSRGGHPRGKSSARHHAGDYWSGAREGEEERRRRAWCVAGRLPMRVTKDKA